MKLSIVPTDYKGWNSVYAYIICDILNHDRLALNKMEVMK